MVDAPLARLDLAAVEPRMQMRVRAANPREVDCLNDVALKAKAYWGYSAEQLASWQESLLTSPESITTALR